jgi:hypothetical protein
VVCDSLSVKVVELWVLVRLLKLLSSLFVDLKYHRLMSVVFCVLVFMEVS